MFINWVLILHFIITCMIYLLNYIYSIYAQYNILFTKEEE